MRLSPPLSTRTRSSGPNLVLQVLDRVQVRGDVVADRGVRAASGAHRRRSGPGRARRPCAGSPRPRWCRCRWSPRPGRRRRAAPGTAPRPGRSCRSRPGRRCRSAAPAPCAAARVRSALWSCRPYPWSWCTVRPGQARGRHGQMVKTQRVAPPLGCVLRPAGQGRARTGRAGQPAGRRRTRRPLRPLVSISPASRASTPGSPHRVKGKQPHRRAGPARPPPGRRRSAPPQQARSQPPPRRPRAPWHDAARPSPHASAQRRLAHPPPLVLADGASAASPPLPARRPAPRAAAPALAAGTPPAARATGCAHRLRRQAVPSSHPERDSLTRPAPRTPVTGQPMRERRQRPRARRPPAPRSAAARAGTAQAWPDRSPFRRSRQAQRPPSARAPRPGTASPRATARRRSWPRARALTTAALRALARSAARYGRLERDRERSAKRWSAHQNRK